MMNQLPLATDEGKNYLDDEKETTELTDSQKTYLVRELKRKTMINAHDLRGSQRLSILCDFLGKVLQHCTYILLHVYLINSLKNCICS